MAIDLSKMLGDQAHCLLEANRSKELLAFTGTPSQQLLRAMEDRNRIEELQRITNPLLEAQKHLAQTLVPQEPAWAEPARKAAELNERLDQERSMATSIIAGLERERTARRIAGENDTLRKMTEMSRAEEALTAYTPPTTALSLPRFDSLSFPSPVPHDFIDSMRRQHEQHRENQLDLATETEERAARSHVENLKQQIREMEARLDPTQDICAPVMEFGKDGIIYIREIRFRAPSTVILAGETDKAQQVEVVRHVTQASLVLVMVKRIDPASIRKPIGFHWPGVDDVRPTTTE